MCLAVQSLENITIHKQIAPILMRNQQKEMGNFTVVWQTVIKETQQISNQQDREFNHCSGTASLGD